MRQRSHKEDHGVQVRAPAWAHGCCLTLPSAETESPCEALADHSKLRTCSDPHALPLQCNRSCSTVLMADLVSLLCQWTRQLVLCTDAVLQGCVEVDLRCAD